MTLSHISTTRVNALHQNAQSNLNVSDCNPLGKVYIRPHVVAPTCVKKQKSVKFWWWNENRAVFNEFYFPLSADIFRFPDWRGAQIKNFDAGQKSPHPKSLQSCKQIYGRNLRYSLAEEQRELHISMDMILKQFSVQRTFNKLARLFSKTNFIIRIERASLLGVGNSVNKLHA